MQGLVGALHCPTSAGLPAMTNPVFRGPSFVYVRCEGRSRPPQRHKYKQYQQISKTLPPEIRPAPSLMSH